MSALYVVVRRLLEFVVLLGHRDRAKEPEILVLRHENGGTGRRTNATTRTSSSWPATRMKSGTRSKGSAK